MTWEELCEKAKEMAKFYCLINEHFIEFERRFVFSKDGEVYIDGYDDACVVATDRTYEQMLAIMEALRWRLQYLLGYYGLSVFLLE